MGGKVHPALVGLQQRVLIGGLVEGTPSFIERRHAGIAAARQVDGREVERQAEQVVAQRTRDEFVDLVAGLAGHTAHDRAGHLVRVEGGELERVEEALDQPDAAIIEGGIEAVDRLGEHRVTEAIDDMRELGDDRRVERDVIAVRNQEHVDVRLDLAGKLFEHEMLILHLGAELGSLEQSLPVPIERGEIGRNGGNRNVQPFIDEGDVVRRQHHTFGVLQQPVVLGVEHVMDCGEADVLVAATIAGYEVRVEQLVVVFGAAIARVAETDFGVTVGNLSDRNGGVGDVVKEGMAGADREMGYFRQRIRRRVVRHDLNQVERGSWCAGSQRRRRSEP